MTISENSTPTYPQPPMPVYRRDSSLAIASLVCGIGTWFILPFFGAIAAIITGHLAKKEIRENPGQLSGDGMATAGLILGYAQIGLIFLGIIAIIVFAFAIGGAITPHLTGPSAVLLKLLI